jgi:hypothetical protein
MTIRSLNHITFICADQLLLMQAAVGILTYAQQHLSVEIKESW